VGVVVERQRRNNPQGKKVVVAGPTRRGPSDAHDERERVMWDGHLFGSLSDNEDDEEDAWDSNPNQIPNPAISSEYED
jgi:hypothetical protein